MHTHDFNFIVRERGTYPGAPVIHFIGDAEQHSRDVRVGMLHMTVPRWMSGAA